VREKPILFSASMVRAILDGSKTQTRRVCKLEMRGGMPEPEMSSLLKCCPYGQLGDQLWVKETHWVDDEDGSVLYAANPDDWNFVEQNKHETGSSRYNWKPSIFMPRKHSRITLEITGVRVERLQDISETDARAEGYPAVNFNPARNQEHDQARYWYRLLWEQINGPGSWEANPWVWAIEFGRVTE